MHKSNYSKDQKRKPNASAMREAKAVGTKSVVASEAGLGAGASAAETPPVAITNIATITATKMFIFNASIVLKKKK